MECSYRRRPTFPQNVSQRTGRVHPALTAKNEDCPVEWEEEVSVQKNEFSSILLIHTTNTKLVIKAVKQNRVVTKVLRNYSTKTWGGGGNRTPLEFEFWTTTE